MKQRTLALAAAIALLAGAAIAQTQPSQSEFAAMDTNGDGKVSRDEHAAAARKMFATMDANGDGKVTAAEMDAAHKKITGKDPAPGDLSSAEKIKAIDQDHDGVLTAAEHAHGARTMFEKMDTNRDEFLTAAELNAGHAAMVKK